MSEVVQGARQRNDRTMIPGYRPPRVRCRHIVRSQRDRARSRVISGDLGATVAPRRGAAQIFFRVSDSYPTGWFDLTGSTMMPGVMRHSDSRAVLTGQVARFQDEIRRLAFAAVREIVKQELDRRLARLAAGARRRTLLAPEPAKPREQPAPEPVAAAEPGPREAAAPSPGNGRKRVPWTREAVIQELASWMASGTAIDAAFVARHGPPGLVAATRRIFGRFDAALNVAGLQVAKLYPDGPPQR